MRRKYEKLSDPTWLENELKKKSIRLLAKEIGCSYSGLVYAINSLGVTRDTVLQKARRESPMKSQNIKQSLKKKFPDGRFGKNSSNWRGGKIRCGKDMKYIAILSPNHPYSTKRGYVMEHRIVMEKFLGRILDPQEIVHHKNGVKHDNRIENLELVGSRGTHTKEHFKRSHITEQLRSIVNSCNSCSSIAKKLNL